MLNEDSPKNNPLVYKVRNQFEHDIWVNLILEVVVTEL